MRLPFLDSASGLRPLAAFVVVTVVLAVVAGRALHISLAGDHRQPLRSSLQVLPAPDYDIVDREGRTLALSVRQLDLIASPRSLWQAHTPRRIARALAEALGQPAAEEELLATLLPDADESGVIRVDTRAILLDDEARLRVELWARGRDADGVRRRGELRGIFTEEVAAGYWQLCWEPALLLSEEQRRSRGGGDSEPVPLLWTRRIADELALCIWPETAALRHGDPEGLKRQRNAIWAALMPNAERVVRRGLKGPEASAVLAMLAEQGVQLHQLYVDFRHERRYPVRSASAGGDPFEIVGRWRYVDRPTALAMACAELGFESVAHCPDPLLPGLRRRAGELLDLRHPASGLERLAGELLARPAWSALAAEPASYRYRRDQPVHKRARHYYLEEAPEGETPRVVSTLDAQLQAWTVHLLEETLAKSDAALAMAMVVELGSGDVLAVAGLSPYEVAEFLPTWHVFTPGSTFKALVMAAALEEGVVRPEEEFFTHNGAYRIEGSRRPPIKEAENSPTGWISASTALARSVNAVMAQIGMRMNDGAYHGYLSALGYGQRPGVGIGVERFFELPALPWRRDWDQASISFGHQLGVNMWQHAAGLAAVLEGGEARPLRLLREVRRDGLAWELPRAQGRRVFSAPVCETVRGMMEQGAREGTGSRLWRREQQAGTPLIFGSKTGTAQKVPTEVCLHNELLRNQRNQERQRRELPPIPFAEARAWPKPGHAECYTSSICVFGRVEGQEREVMVLLVVEEPRGSQRFGSHVAGPAAMDLLKEALGLTRNGRSLELANDPADFAASALEEQNLDDLPWAVEVMAAW